MKDEGTDHYTTKALFTYQIKGNFNKQRLGWVCCSNKKTNYVCFKKQILELFDIGLSNVKEKANKQRLGWACCGKKELIYVWFDKQMLWLFDKILINDLWSMTSASPYLDCFNKNCARKKRYKVREWQIE